ncbi:TetR family transcriptional regulator [Kribbella orskensis]|uniref:TetR family transcriptional regulator n=1 Tax=Kribbella orskensis TaxID=2512216 RepID=A0ABY2BTE9_9ACTN|nr:MULTISPECIES: TetR/AcrR family transcriptional regulator [Kribbella]TCN44680.1 TetR family transcriptional regulator [Kribbella sp. VKM Ac-2500]TCO31542.1 TetR family transcriptional regulator [Kribbella orskensis]
MRQAERRAQTTNRVLDAAAAEFARRGFHAATIDDIARTAGYTKGAVYANFAGKDALILALIDRHLEDQLAQLDLLLANTSTADLRTSLRNAAVEQNAAGGPFGLLMLEFWLYAARDAAAKASLAERYQRMRDRLAAAIADRDAARGDELPLTAHEVAALVLALDAGLFLQHLLDPHAVTPELRANALTAVMDLPRPTG